MISLLHATARPGRWKEIYSQWHSNCDNPKDVEYVLIWEPRYFTDTNTFRFLDIKFRHTIIQPNLGRPCVVDAYNQAADQARGDLLFYIADDFWSMPHWDTDILSHTTKRPAEDAIVYWVNTGDGADKINHPLFTRGYFESFGFYLWPEYEDLFSDTEFHDVAERAGAIVDLRSDLFFTHAQAGTDKAKYPHDDVNLRMLSHWAPQEALYNRRKAAGFPMSMVNMNPLGACPNDVYVPQQRRGEFNA